MHRSCQKLLSRPFPVDKVFWRAATPQFLPVGVETATPGQSSIVRVTHSEPARCNLYETLGCLERCIRSMHFMIPSRLSDEGKPRCLQIEAVLTSGTIVASDRSADRPRLAGRLSTVNQRDERIQHDQDDFDLPA